MSEAHNIYDDFLKIEHGDYTAIRKFHHDNSLILDNINIFNDKEDFLSYLIILAQCIIGLEKAGDNKKTINYANKYLQFIESRANEFGIKQADCIQYQSILVSKGRALYNIGDFKNSIAVFKQLLEWDPENDYFQKWIDATESIVRISINKYLYIIATILVIIAIIFGDQIGNPTIKIFVKLSGFIIFAIALINEHLVGRILKVIKK